MKFCFIAGAGRSGTTLLQALLDGHPECAVWPFELSFHELWENAVEKTKSDDPSRCLRSVLNGVLLANERVHKLGKPLEGSATVLDTTGFDKKRFLDLLQSDEDSLDTAVSYLVHIGASFRWNEHQAVFVLRHNDLPPDWYHDNFPGACHIVMLRDPIENYLAYQKFRIAGRRSFILDLPIGILTQFSMLRVFQGFWAAESSSISNMPMRLEDISASPVEAMNSIAEKLGIEKRDEWKPSVLGNTFSGNSTRGKSEGVRKFTAGYKKKLTRNEYECFKINKRMFTQYYPEMFDGLEIVLDQIDIEKLYQERLLDGTSAIKNMSRTKWNNLYDKLRYFKNHKVVLHETELKALVSMDTLLLPLVTSPSCRNRPV